MDVSGGHQRQVGSRLRTLWSTVDNSRVERLAQICCRLSAFVSRREVWKRSFSHVGRLGSSFTTSSPRFLTVLEPEVGLIVPLCMLFKPLALRSSRVVSTRVGLPMAFSVGRLKRFHIIQEKSTLVFREFDDMILWQSVVQINTPHRRVPRRSDISKGRERPWCESSRNCCATLSGAVYDASRTDEVRRVLARGGENNSKH